MEDAVLPLKRDEMIALWRKRFKTEPPKSLGPYLIRDILIHEDQKQQFGGLDRESKATLRHIQKQLKTPPDRPVLKTRPIRPGAKLIREWNGKTHIVEVLETGYKYKGKEFKSLSALAKYITGAHWSGPRFFGLKVRPHV